MHTSPRRIARIAFASTLAGSFVSLVALTSLTNCTSDSPTTPAASLAIGPEGGALASSDYVMEILVPAGALTTTVIFTITPVDSPATGSLAPSYTITSDPPNPTFLVPAVVSYTEEVIGSPVSPAFNDPSDYKVAAYESNAWAPLANQSVDALADTVEGTTTTLSTGAYSVIIPTATNCVNVVATQTCAADDGGCTAPTCDPVLPGKCAAYPGSVAESCALNGAGTVMTTSCCVPAGQQVCFIEAETNGCNSPCSGFPGAVATSCVPDIGPPIENGPIGNGVAQATCCFPAGTGLAYDGGVEGDAGTDASSEAGVVPSDAATEASVVADAGSDAGNETADAGTDAGVDAGPGDASDDGG